MRLIVSSGTDWGHPTKPLHSDLLLPKLMSDEIRLKDAEKADEKVAWPALSLLPTWCAWCGNRLASIRKSLQHDSRCYPPDLQDAAVQTVLLQAEELSAEWAGSL